jgi:hypothetical protein
MIVSWTPQPSPDDVKPATWRVRLAVKLQSPAGPSHSVFFHATADTGALWTSFTDDYARIAGVWDIESGRPTKVRWFGLDLDGWQHRVGWSLATNQKRSETITFDPMDVLFIHRFAHPRSGKPVSLAVVGMDWLARLCLTLDGPAAVTRF